MAQEIEHKFLVKRQHLPARMPPAKKIVQGYLSLNPAVRVRIISGKSEKKAFITIKGRGLRSRAEFEYAIPVADARQLMKLCGKYTIEKLRREIGGWEIDEFKGRHRGLWLAEYELKNARARLPKLPPWAGREVTGDPRFSNARLSAQPFDKRMLLE